MKNLWKIFKSWFRDGSNIVLTCVLLFEFLVLVVLILRTISITFFVM